MYLKKLSIPLLIIIYFIANILFLAACSSEKTNPNAVIKRYLESTVKGEYKSSYQYLTRNVQSQISETDYIKIMRLAARNAKIKKLELIRLSRFNRKGDMGWITYEMLVTFNNKDKKALRRKINMIYEEGEWHVVWVPNAI